MKNKLIFLISIIIILLLSWLVGRQIDETNLIEKTATELDQFITIQKDLSESDQEKALVTRIIDGDTIEINTGEKVRLIGIDTPETKAPNKGIECFGPESTLAISELILNKEIVLKKDVSETDRYNRLLRYIYIDDIFVNEHLVRNGFATAVSFPPDVTHQELFRDAEREARELSRGLWDKCQ